MRVPSPSVTSTLYLVGSLLLFAAAVYDALKTHEQAPTSQTTVRAGPITVTLSPRDFIRDVTIAVYEPVQTLVLPAPDEWSSVGHVYLFNHSGKPVTIQAEAQRLNGVQGGAYVVPPASPTQGPSGILIFCDSTQYYTMVLEQTQDRQQE